MKLEEIVKKNKEFLEFKESLNIWLDEKKNEINEINKNIDLKSFKELEYDEAKTVFAVLKETMSNSKSKEELENALLDLKVKRYPIMKEAHYYPQINKLDWLTSDMKRSIDEVLMLSQGNHIYKSSRRWINLQLSDEELSRLFNDLYELGIAERSFLLNCKSCCNGLRFISEEEYVNLEKYLRILEKVKTNTASEEDKDWVLNYQEQEGSDYSLYCLGCDCDTEVDSLEVLKEVVTPQYKIVAKADYYYSNL